MNIKRKIKHIKRELAIIRCVLTEEKIAVRQIKSLPRHFFGESNKDKVELIDGFFSELDNHQEHIRELDMRASDVADDVR
jgi:hypothetical protein